ncbi:MAG: hypothetical protein KatS3mg087_1012 [Patescibacteria group bacterium]|nr:MAG: hypothetical protein KatS3mg087_1012 [Patescibacteria group bacterium]
MHKQLLKILHKKSLYSDSESLCGDKKSLYSDSESLCGDKNHSAVTRSHSAVTPRILREKKKESSKERKRENEVLDLNNNNNIYNIYNIYTPEVNTNSAHARTHAHARDSKTTLDINSNSAHAHARIINLTLDTNTNIENNSNQEIKTNTLFEEIEQDLITVGRTTINFAKLQIPQNCNKQEIKEAIIQWLKYRSHIKKPYKCAEQQLQILIDKYQNDFPNCVKFSIAQGYQGCFPDNSQKSRNNRDIYTIYYTEEEYQELLKIRNNNNS